MCRAREQHALAEECAAVEPRDLLAQSYDVTDDRDCGRADSGGGDVVGDRRERAGGRALRRPRSVLNDRDGRLCNEPVRDQLRGDLAQIADRHQQHERAMRIGEPRPVDRRCRFGGIFVTGRDRKRRVVRTMRYRDAGVRRCGDRGRNAGHHFERYAGGAQRLRFLGAASEDERVAALEPHHALAFASFRCGERFDLFLRHRVIAAALADEDAFACGRRHRNDRIAGERIVKEHVRMAQDVGGA